MTQEWITYRQAALSLGISLAALKKRAMRGRWPRRQGNDGVARIQLPEEACVPTASPGRPAPVSRDMSRPLSRPEDQLKITELETEIRLLREMLADMRQDRDHWRQTADRLLGHSDERRSEQNTNPPHAPAAIERASTVADILERMKQRRAGAA